MPLSERLSRNVPSNGAAAVTSLGMVTSQRREAPKETGEAAAFRELKGEMLDYLLHTLDVGKIESLDQAQVQAKLTAAINEHLQEQDHLVTDADRLRLIEEVKNEILGLGPLEPLLSDDATSDILVNGCNEVYIERGGKLYKTDVVFQDDAHLLNVIGRIVASVGRRIDEASPMVDARLADGSRVNAIIPPLALDGPVLSIRRFGREPLTIDALIRNGTLTTEMAEFLNAIVKARLNLLVCGGTGSGKTTLLNCLTSFIPRDERIITIEDSAELSLQQPHVVRLETRPPNLEGKGEVTQRDLVRNSLRMRPDRIVVGEVRGAEVIDMLQAMSTGHDGSISTIHANNPRDSLNRLEMMMMFSGFALPDRAMRTQISSALNLFLHVSRLSDGTRKLVKISEVSGVEGDMISMQDLFEFVRTGVSPEGKVLGTFRPTGIRSVYSKRLEAAGLHLDSKLFGARQAVSRN
jgi:pilus assembly protein CpaF